MKNDALEKLYEKYYSDAKFYILSMCRDPATADDVVAEAFFRAFTTIDEEKDSFRFWLLKVCRNCYIDYLRRSNRLTELSDDTPSGGEELAAGLIKKEEYRALYRAISLLKKNYKEIILLYYFEGLTVNEIASVTGQTTENVKVQMYRARIKLKELLEDTI